MKQNSGTEPCGDPNELQERLSASAEAVVWVRTLTTELRGAIRDLHEIRPQCNVVVLFFAALWAVGAWLIVRYGLVGAFDVRATLAEPWAWSLMWTARLAGYSAIGISLHGLVVVMHEGIHGSLCRRRGSDRWFGFFLGIPSLVSFTAYRVTHLAHHRHNRTADDPDEFSNLTPNRRLLAVAFYLWIVAGTVTYFFFHVPITAWQRGKAEERRAVLVEYGILLVLYACFVAVAVKFHWLPYVVHCWLIPMLVAVLAGNIRGWAEHMLTIPGHPLTQSRTVTSNRVVSFLTLNLNYHLEHHLFPGIPWYNLPAVHALLQDEYRRAGSFIYRSYLVFLWDAAREGVFGLAPKRRGGSVSPVAVSSAA